MTIGSKFKLPKENFAFALKAIPKKLNPDTLPSPLFAFKTFRVRFQHYIPHIGGWKL